MITIVNMFGSPETVKLGVQSIQGGLAQFKYILFQEGKNTMVIKKGEWLSERLS